MISIDRYINVVRKKYYKRVFTNKSLAIAIILVILISFMHALFETDFKAKLDIKKTAILYFDSLLLLVGFIVALLRNVEHKTKNFSS